MNIKRIVSDTQALRDLLVKVEAGELPPTKLIVQAFGSNMLTRGWRVTDLIYWAMNPADIRGIGACQALHDEMLPGWPTKVVDHTQEWLGAHGWNVIVNWPLTLQAGSSRGANRAFEAWSDTPSRAWLICILRAMIAQATP